MNYLLRDVDEGLWSQFRDRAASDGRPMRWLIVELIRFYVRHGLPAKGK